mmetsp:Transcript_19173/g.48208  ORF Transcript_19173/g.48208 Transcript_19173/m.48208 type:complete len:90 (+) Transcript_19173:163-432(+)
MLGHLLAHIVPMGGLGGTMLIKARVPAGCDDCFAPIPSHPTGEVGWKLGFPDVASTVFRPEEYTWRNREVDDYCPDCFEQPAAPPYSTY